MDHVTSIKDIDKIFGGIGKTTELVGNQRPNFVKHMETSVNSSISILRIIEKPLQNIDLCKHVNGNGANGNFP